jgi:transcriptional regulator with XRE-family HTH domain
MREFVKNLKRRMAELGFTGAEVARRSGVSTRAFGHYAGGDNEPNLTVLTRIAKALDTSPNLLLGFEKSPKKKSEQHLRERIDAALNVMDAEDQKVVAACADAILKTRKR